MELLFVDKNVMDCHLHFGTFSFYFTCVYGDPCLKHMHRVWKIIIRIGISRKDSWSMLGDFNELLYNGKNIGAFEDFGKIIEGCRMSELPSHGNGFTWGGMRHKLWIQSKLDRCFSNKDWLSMFPVASQMFFEKRIRSQTCIS